MGEPTSMSQNILGRTYAWFKAHPPGMYINATIFLLLAISLQFTTLLSNVQEPGKYVIADIITLIMFLFVGFYGLTSVLGFKYHNRKKYLLYWALNLFVAVAIFAHVFKYAGLKDTATNTVLHNGAISLYFSVITFTTLGYGDFVPVSGYSRIFAGVEALTGYVFLGLLIAAITHTYANQS